MEDTIAAISTPLGTGGIAIVRVSGPSALAVGDAVFHSSRGKPSQFLTHTVHYGRIVQDNAVVDQVMLVVFRTPHSYTTEDTVEIHCHGGVLAARSILSICLQHGARLAEPGEFTKRAFLNGRIDLTQAEAVMDLISAQTQFAQTVAARALEGHLLLQIKTVREKIADLSAQLEAYLDFPDEDIQSVTCDTLSADLKDSTSCLQELLNTGPKGRILRDGMRVAIVGRPNAGKSSIMNALLGRERSIVTAVAGTTRDSIEDMVAISGFPVRLTDTAGFRYARGAVESEGIKQAINTLDHAEIVLHIIDRSRPFSTLDSELDRLTRRKSVIHVYNKIDLPRKLKLPIAFEERNPLDVSALTGEGIERLRNMIAKTITAECVGTSAVDVTVNERQALALDHAVACLTDAAKAITAGEGIELACHHLRGALNAIGEITGETTHEDILDRIFSSFCIGK